MKRDRVLILRCKMCHSLFLAAAQSTGFGEVSEFARALNARVLRRLSAFSC